MEHLYFLFFNRGIQFVLHFRSSRLMWCGRPVKILPSPRYSSFFTVSDINCHYQCFKFNTHQSSRLLLEDINDEAEYLAIARFQPRPAELMSYGHVFLFLIDCYYIYLSLMHICDLCQTLVYHATDTADRTQTES